MRELLFPLTALAGVGLVLIPALSALSLAALRRRAARVSWARFGGIGTLGWLALPSASPALWLLSSALHLNEPQRAIACAPRHEGMSCWDVALLLAVSCAALLLAARRRLAEAPRLELTPRPLTDPAAARVARLIEASPALRDLRACVVEAAPAAAFVYGWLRPQVILRRDFVEALDDEALLASLLHEQAHARRLDPLLDLLAEISLTLNPLAAWLRPHLGRWRDAREALRDAQAVHAGGAPLALATGILKAARGPSPLVSLCSHGALTLKLRLNLLLEGGARLHKSAGAWIFMGLLAAALIAPHLPRLDLLGALHHAVEALPLTSR